MFHLFLHIPVAAAQAAKAARVTIAEEAFKAFDAFRNGLLNWFEAKQLNLIEMLLGILLTLAVVFLVRRIVTAVLLHRSRKLPFRLPGQLIGQLNAPVAVLLLLIGFTLSIEPVFGSTVFWIWIKRGLYAGFIVTVVWAAFRMINVADSYLQTRKINEDHHLNELVVVLIRRGIKALVWVCVIIFVAQNVFQFDVTALVAGAGVAGLAIAFAAQNTVANLFGAMSIISDRTFKKGDRILINDASGSVEEVGFRSTRLRSLDGTVWHVPNRIASDSVIQNITERPWFKYAFTLGLVYQTAPERMHRALEILAEILNNHPGFNMESHPPLFFFTNFNASSLDIDVTLWFQTVDYVQFQQWKQEINLSILEKFNAAGLDFAYPTSTNYLIAENNNTNTATIEGAVGK